MRAKRRSGARLATFAASGLTLLSGLAMAGLGESGSRPTPATEGAIAPTVPGGSQIRCWQEGRLLFQERLSADPAIPSSVRTMRADTPAGPVQLLKLDSAICLVESQGTRPAAGKD